MKFFLKAVRKISLSFFVKEENRKGEVFLLQGGFPNEIKTQNIGGFPIKIETEISLLISDSFAIFIV